MNVAKFLERTFNAIDLDDDRNFLDGDQLAIFRAVCNAMASQKMELSPESYDSSIVFSFEDGSSLVLDNPRQAAYCAAIRV